MTVMKLYVWDNVRDLKLDSIKYRKVLYLIFISSNTQLNIHFRRFSCQLWISFDALQQPMSYIFIHNIKLQFGFYPAIELHAAFFLCTSYKIVH